MSRVTERGRRGRLGGQNLGLALPAPHARLVATCDTCDVAGVWLLSEPRPRSLPRAVAALRSGAPRRFIPRARGWALPRRPRGRAPAEGCRASSRSVSAGGQAGPRPAPLGASSFTDTAPSPAGRAPRCRYRPGPAPGAPRDAARSRGLVSLGGRRQSGRKLGSGAGRRSGVACVCARPPPCLPPPLLRGDGGGDYGGGAGSRERRRQEPRRRAACGGQAARQRREGRLLRGAPDVPDALLQVRPGPARRPAPPLPRQPFQSLPTHSTVLPPAARTPARHWLPLLPISASCSLIGLQGGGVGRVRAVEGRVSGAGPKQGQGPACGQRFPRGSFRAGPAASLLPQPRPPL